MGRSHPPEGNPKARGELTVGDQEGSHPPEGNPKAREEAEVGD
jgi:hypothetical protein